MDLWTVYFILPRKKILIEKEGFCMMDAATMDFDLSELIPIPQPRSSFPVYSVNVSQRGYVALNQKFLDVLKEKIPSLAVGFRIHPNKQMIAIFQSDHPNYQFPGGGRIKDTAFTKSLVDAGVVLPARYAVNWNEKNKCFVGILVPDNQVPDADVLAKSLDQPSRRGRKSK